MTETTFSSLKRLGQFITVIFTAMLVASFSGCGSVQSGSSAKSAGMSTNEPTPIDAWNNYLNVLADGNKDAMRRCAYVHPGEKERERFERSLDVLNSTARLRKVCDQAYGQGKLVNLGFRCFKPGTQLPKNATFQVEGDHATISVPGQDTIRMIRKDKVWKEDFLPWSELMAVRAKSNDPGGLLLEELLPNLESVRRILDQTTTEVATRNYLSAADAYGVLNARLRGQALGHSPLVIAYMVDLTRTNLASAKTIPVPIIELRGAPAALGEAHGAQLGEGIRTLYHEYFDRAFNLGSAEGRQLYQRVLKVASHFERFLLPEHSEELRALGRSTGFKPAEVLLGQCFPDLNAGGACSTISLPAEGSADGIARFGRNLDYETFGVLEKHSVILVFHPEERYAFASIGAPGCVGVLSGMNEHGLALAVMEVPRRFRRPQAMPFMLLYRCVLENCKTVQEAIDFLEKTPRQSANNLMLMDASGDRAVAEITPAKVTVRRAPGTAALISTNHQRGGDLDSADRCVRFDVLHDASRRCFGHISEPDLEKMLSGAAQGDATFQSMIFEPSNLVVYLAVGAGAPSQGFRRIELKPYFGMKP